jgi:DNA-directed RNA polymerase subunit RPC12/RpoP
MSALPLPQIECPRCAHLLPVDVDCCARCGRTFRVRELWDHYEALMALATR